MKKLSIYSVLGLALVSIVGVTAFNIFTRKPVTRFPAAILSSPSTLNKYLPLIRIKNNTNTSQCSASVVSSHYAVTAGHCLIDEETGRLNKASYHVFDAHGVDTNLDAIGVGASGQVDYGLILGDFNEFQNITSNPNEPELLLTAGMPHIMCGFPMGRKEYLCSPFYPVARLFFFIRGTGFTMPGMSGGAVINTVTGNIDAVISGAVENGEAVVAPIFAIFEAFGIEMQ